ncbi:MAG: hypothetical protein MUO72_00630 [Bacteroidales bacterium]|nr:hypothetical protein [Bacteroidales bacterium]
MTSLIPGFEYDIFISYRQKDNKGDRWVSEFVEALKTELESTFKEEISVYFDINPHDGLLETHDVDASLKDKLKCLVFIPIISRTYCDPKSFAWEHEFKAFVEEASQDQFGLKVKLPNGNVANRVLPVRIHDLDIADIKECESVLGGVLRGIEFIYKSAGVNRPLRAGEDHPKDNLNKTYFRDQINKVANAIKDIITVLGQNEQNPAEVIKEVYKPISVPRKNRKTTIIIGSVITLALIILGYLLIPRLFKSSEQLEKSIAVLPFRNDSPDDSTQYFMNGVMEELLANLQKIKDIRVLGRTSVEQYREKNKPIPEIAEELNVNYIVTGSGQKSDKSFRMRVQLIRVNNESNLWAKSFETASLNLKEYFHVQSQFAKAIANELHAVITPEEKQLIERIPTESLDAYEAYLKGYDYNRKLTENDLATAMQYFELAKEIDPEFVLAYAGISRVWSSRQGIGKIRASEANPRAEAAIIKALELDSTHAEVYRVLASIKTGARWDWKGGEESIRKAIKLSPNNADYHASYSGLLRILGRYDEAMKHIEIALTLDPFDPLIKTEYGNTLLFRHKYDNAVTAFREALNLYPTQGGAENIVPALFLAGREQEAIEMQRYRWKNNSEYIRALNEGYAEAGFQGGCKKLADLRVERLNTTYSSPWAIATQYSMAGDTSNAMFWMEKAYEEHQMGITNILSPTFDKLRENSRFQKIARKMNLPYK